MTLREAAERATPMKIWEALGLWSSEICRPDAVLAPPDYLLAAVNAVTDDRDRLQRERDALAEAADVALNALIGCCIAGPGVDDRKHILEAQAMLREALAGRSS